MKHINISVYGRVQGVGYRQAARTQARYLGVKGFVKNCSDGSVYIEAEGESSILYQYVQWCRKGPDFAEVSNLEISNGDMKNHIGFDARY